MDGTVKPKITIIVVEDEDLSRKAMVSLLSQHDNIEVIGHTGDGEEAIRLFRERPPHVLVLDLVLKRDGQPQKLQGVDVIKQLRAEYKHNARILAITAYSALQIVLPPIRAGALGMVHKYDTSSTERLFGAIFNVALGEKSFSDKVKNLLLRRFADSSSEIQVLSDREREVAALVMEELSNKEVARRLFIAENTVKVHLRNIFDKLDISRRDDVWRGLMEDEARTESYEEEDDNGNA